MNSSVQQSLKVVRTLLSGHGGSKAALSFLERRTKEQYEIHESAIIWACLSDLREQVGDVKGAREAAERATLLRSAPVRTLSFEENDSLSSLNNTPIKPQVSKTPVKTSTPSSWMNINVHTHSTPVNSKSNSLFTTLAIHEALKKSSSLGNQCRQLLKDTIQSNNQNVSSSSKSSQQLALDRSSTLGKCTALLLERSI